MQFSKPTMNNMGFEIGWGTIYEVDANKFNISSWIRYYAGTHTVEG